MARIIGGRSKTRSTLLVLLLTLSGITPTVACEVTVGWSPWPPYHYADEQGQIVGLDAEIMALVMAEIDCQITWFNAAWRRQLQDLRGNRLDAVMSASYTAERAAWGQFSDAYRQSTNHLVTRADLTGRYASLEAFLADGKSLGVMRDFHYGQEIDRLLSNDQYRAQISRSPVADVNIRRLASSRLDGVLMDIFVAKHLIREMGFVETISSQGLQVSADNLHMLFAPGLDDATVTRFNAAMAKLKRNGKIRKIINRYRYCADKSRNGLGLTHKRARMAQVIIRRLLISLGHCY